MALFLILKKTNKQTYFIVVKYGHTKSCSYQSIPPDELGNKYLAARSSHWQHTIKAYLLPPSFLLPSLHLLLYFILVRTYLSFIP